jgi:glycerol-3-phosphate dehydrogenase
MKSESKGKDKHSPSPLATREAVRGVFTKEILDVLIIGGGIVGAGVARDCAMRGLRTALVEQHDFAFGTSSRSSRLLHGGMRYLAQGRIGLVREASMEKRVIHRIAPHLAAPLPFVFPTYRGDRDWKLWQLKIGVKLYDLLCGGRNLGNSSWLSPMQTSERVPALNRERLAGSVRYFDGFTNDARLVLDTLRSAVRHHALALNYCRFKNAARSSDDVWICQLYDGVSGADLEVRASTVVNATGPWAEALPHSSVKLRLTKGIHLVLNHSRLPVEETVVMTEGSRILFAIPWGERVILGTTDTDYEGSLDEVTATQSDVQYVLKVANGFFPGAKLIETDVLSTWAGLRPLIASAKGRPSDISRSHEIRTPEPGWWDVAGGKLTTYRLMAEQVTDQLGAWVHKTASAKSHADCRTAIEPLLPTTETEGISAIVPPTPSRELVRHFCANEWAMHLDDVMVRRSSWHYYCPEAAAIALKVADWMAEFLGWDAQQKNHEVERYRSSTSYRSIGL